jgi:WD40 repeat protein/serine/threonine protein kinase
MPQLSSCPDSSRLERLLNGALALAEVEELAQHLETCDRCADSARQLPSGDPLLEAVRSGLATTGDPYSTRMPGGLLQGLKSLHPGNEPTVETRNISSGTPSPESGAVNRHGFLAPAEQPGELGRFAGYRVLSELGAGGMGIVFLGEDPRLKRLVALKVMTSSLAGDELARERFEREARAMAAVEHDHIVPIYQVGEDRGVPFLAMPLLKGETLETRLRRGSSIPLPEVLRIGREVAAGLAAAHASGLIHRDVKPGNLWLEAGAGRVKILDFGLARAAADGLGITRPGMIVGTPAYMAPEQANGLPAEPRSDLFSLGCVLYRLATGRLPFQADHVMGILAAIVNTNPVPPRQLNPHLPTQLNDLILRLLAKGPAQRPASAQAVVEALAAIESRLAPPRPPQPRRRWGRLVAVATALLAMVGGGFLAHEIIIRIKGKDGRTTEIRTDGDARVEIEKDGTVITVGNDTRPKPPANTTPKPPPTTQPTPPPRTERPKPPSSEKPKPPSTEKPVWTPVKPPPSGPSPFDALQRRLVSAYERRMAGDPPELVAVLGDSRMKDPASVKSIAFSPDGKRLAAGGFVPSSDHIPIRIWSVDTGELLLSIEDDDTHKDVKCVRFSPDGKVLAGTAMFAVNLWNAETGRLVKKLDAPSQAFVKSLSFSRDGKQLAAGGGSSGEPGNVIVFDLETGRGVERARHSHEIFSVCFSPDGKHVASGGGKHYKAKERAELVVSDASGQVRDRASHKDEVHSVAYSPDGTLLASAGSWDDKTIKIWEPNTLKELRTLTGHGSHINEVQFHPDGKRLAAIDYDGKVIIWDVEKGTQLQSFQAMQFGDCVCFNPKGTLLAAAGGFDHDAIRLWDLASGKELFPPRGHTTPVVSLRVAPDRRQIISTSPSQYRTHHSWPDDEDIIKWWDVATGQELRSSPVIRGAARPLARRGVSPDGKYEVCLDWVTKEPDSLVVRTCETRAEKISVKGRFAGAFCFSPDSKCLAAVMHHPDVIKAWDVQTGTEVWTSPPYTPATSPPPAGTSEPRDPGPASPRILVCSPDGSLLAGDSRVADAPAIKVWDTATGKELWTITGLDYSPTSLAFSPDGTRLVTTERDESDDPPRTRIRILEARSGKVIAQLKAALARTSSICFSPNGRLMAGPGLDGTVVVSDASTGKLVRTIKLASRTRCVVFGDDRNLVTGHENGQIYVLRLAYRPGSDTPKP